MLNINEIINNLKLVIKIQSFLKETISLNKQNLKII